MVTEDGRCYTGSALNASNFKSSIGAITSALSRMISRIGHTHVSQVWFSASDERRPEIRLESCPSWHELETLQEFGDPEIVLVEETGAVLFRRQLSAIIPTIAT